MSGDKVYTLQVNPRQVVKYIPGRSTRVRFTWQVKPYPSLPGPALVSPRENFLRLYSTAQAIGSRFIQELHLIQSINNVKYTKVNFWNTLLKVEARQFSEHKAHLNLPLNTIPLYATTEFQGTVVNRRIN